MNITFGASLRLLIFVVIGVVVTGDIDANPASNLGPPASNENSKDTGRGEANHQATKYLRSAQPVNSERKLDVSCHPGAGNTYNNTVFPELPLTTDPTDSPTQFPTESPTEFPTEFPTNTPTTPSPTKRPTQFPTKPPAKPSNGNKSSSNKESNKRKGPSKQSSKSKGSSNKHSKKNSNKSKGSSDDQPSKGNKSSSNKESNKSKGSSKQSSKSKGSSKQSSKSKGSSNTDSENIEDPPELPVEHPVHNQDDAVDNFGPKEETSNDAPAKVAAKHSC